MDYSAEALDFLEASTWACMDHFDFFIKQCSKSELKLIVLRSSFHLYK